MDKVDLDKKEIYKCNPMKNTSCSKTRCFYNKIIGECMYTTNPEYSRDGVAYSVRELFEEEQARKAKRNN